MNSCDAIPIKDVDQSTDVNRWWDVPSIINLYRGVVLSPHLITLAPSSALPGATSHKNDCTQVLSCHCALHIVGVYQCLLGRGMKQDSISDVLTASGALAGSTLEPAIFSLNLTLHHVMTHVFFCFYSAMTS